VTKQWTKVEGSTIYSVFTQTADGFELKGNVAIDGDLITTGTISADRIASDISQVYDVLYIGEKNYAGAKKIIFSNRALITASGVDSPRITISASEIVIDGDLTVTGTINGE
jgi:hypothetical protein